MSKKVLVYRGSQKTALQSYCKIHFYLWSDRKKAKQRILQDLVSHVLMDRMEEEKS